MNLNVFTELISIFTYVCAKFQYPYWANIACFRKSKLLLGLYLITMATQLLPIKESDVILAFKSVQVCVNLWLASETLWSS